MRIINKSVLFFYVFVIACSNPTESKNDEKKENIFSVNNREQFDEALKSAKAGDEIVFQNGRYNDMIFIFKAQGEESNPIIFRAETAGEVIFSGKTQIFIEGDWLAVSGFKLEEIADIPNITTPYNVLIGSVITFRKNTNHSRLTETAIINSGTKVSSYFHMEPGGQYNQVDYCYFSGQKDIGPSLYIEVDPEKPNYAILENCFIGNRLPGTGNRWETLRIGHSLQQYFISNTTVRGNYFTKCDGENEMVSNKSTGNKYLYNSFISNRGELTLRHGDEIWIEGNFFDDPEGVGSPGIRLSGARHIMVNNYFKRLRFAFNVYNGESNPQPTGYTQVKDAVIAFNTVEDCEDEFMLGTTNRPMVPSNLRIFYNLVQSKGGTILNYSNKSTDAGYQGNIMYGGTIGITNPGISSDKPTLVDETWGHLVVDKESLQQKADRTAIQDLTLDLNGTTRPDACNIGAIEVPGIKPCYPLSPQNVGPKWMGRNTD